jgi:CRISPR-associated endonuclease/helicase Cas3
MLEFWAKSGRPEDAAPMHSVPHHSLDVAACARLLVPTLRPPVDVEPATLASLVALHDVGKFTRTFQGKVEALWPDCLGAYASPRAGWPHDEAGYALLLSDQLAGHLDPLFGSARPFSPLVAGRRRGVLRPPTTSRFSL